MLPFCILTCAIVPIAPFVPRPQFLINDRTNDAIYRISYGLPE